LLESQHGKFVGRSLVNPYWIKTEGVRLAIIPRPRGQDWLPDDISLLQRAGIDVVVSALTAAENEELGLVEESRCCQSRGIEFLSFPIEDRSVPNSSAEFTELVNSVTDFLRKGKAVAVHCRAGIGRSSMVVASALIHIGHSTESAFRSIEESRGCTVPDTHEQRRWVERHSSGFGSFGK
jgi:protein-tyrosine phosphatase